jgi:hypothetical protein
VKERVIAIGSMASHISWRAGKKTRDLHTQNERKMNSDQPKKLVTQGSQSLVSQMVKISDRFARNT